jgi:predicted dehydrogenase
MPRIHVGLVGAGVIAGEHAKSLYLNRDAGGLTVFDVDRERAAALASRVDGNVAPTLAALCRDCDLVWVASPQFTHRKAVLAACEAGKPVFCEKPLAHTVADVNRIREAVRKAGVPFFMGHSGRFNHVFSKLCELVEKGTIGELTKVWSLRQGYVAPASRAAWCFDNRKSGGAIVELGVHEIDFALWLGGPFRSVYATALPGTLAAGKCQDAVIGLGRLANGATASIDVSWANPRYLWQRGAVGTEGSLLFDDSRFPSVLFSRPGKKPRVFKTSNWIYEPTGEGESIRKQVKAVLTALRRGEQPPVTLEDGIAAMQVAFAMRESARTGKPVRL